MYRFILGYGIDPQVPPLPPPLPTANTRLNPIQPGGGKCYSNIRKLRFCMWDHLKKGIRNKDLVVKQPLRLSKLNTFDLSLIVV